eukprot:882393-Pelagomonas_calceolata.AAC.2
MGADHPVVLQERCLFDPRAGPHLSPGAWMKTGGGGGGSCVYECARDACWSDPCGAYRTDSSQGEQTQHEGKAAKGAVVYRAGLARLILCWAADRSAALSKGTRRVLPGWT